MFENYKNWFFNDKVILKLQERFKSDYYNVYTEQINKIALSYNDDKRLQTLLQHIRMEHVHSKHAKVRS